MSDSRWLSVPLQAAHAGFASDYGPPDNPWPELPPAASLYDVHWRKGGPGVSPLRLVMGMTFSGNSGNTTHGTLSVSESGTESGSVSLVWSPTTTDPQGLLSMGVVSWSGSTSMFNQNPTHFVSVAPGAAWTLTLTISIYLDPPPPGLPTSVAEGTATVVSIDAETGLINGSLAAVFAEALSGTSSSASTVAGGIAPT